MVSQVATLYGWISLSALAWSPKVMPTSMTSGACGPGIVLVGLDRLDLVTGARVGRDLVDGEAVLGLEAVDDRAVVAPVVRQRDDRERAFLLGGGDERRDRRSDPAGAAPPDAAADAAADGAPGSAPVKNKPRTRSPRRPARPASRVTERCVDNIHPPVVDVDLHRTTGGDLLPLSPGLRPPVWRTAWTRGVVFALHWTARVVAAVKRMGSDLLTAFITRCEHPPRNALVHTRIAPILALQQSPGPRRRKSLEGRSLTAGPGEPGDPRTLQDPLAEALRVVDLADKRGLLVRLMGGHGHPGPRPGLAGPDPPGRGRPRLRHAGQGPRRLLRPAASEGYTADKRHNALFGGKQAYFVDVPRSRPVDVLVDRLEMCHRFEFADRLVDVDARRCRSPSSCCRSSRS